MAFTSTITWGTVYDDVLQDRLDHPTTWKEMCKVEMTDSYTISTSYLTAPTSATTVTRSTGLVGSSLTEIQESFNVSTGKDVGLFVDLANLAQSNWTKPAELFDRIGALLNEAIEAAVLATYATWTTFDNASIGGSAGNITVSASNIDDIIRGVKREIRKNNGQSMMNKNGVGFVWRAADFEYLEAFVQANGFTTADAALKEGTVEGLHYLGADHYWSNDHTTGHVFAGVKKMVRLGILRGTYGQAHTIDFPAADSNTFLSGKAFYSRVDYGTLTPTGYAGNVFNVTVA